MILRPATPEDLPRLLPLVASYHAHEGITSRPDQALADTLLGLLAHPDRGRIWLIEQDGQPAGYLAIAFGYSIELGGREAAIDEIFVTPDHRGKGLGAKALTSFLDWAKHEHLVAIHLDVAPDNDGARRLYARLGFESFMGYELMSCLLPSGIAPEGH
ncbi:GNAT family N-acetyltransferase [Nioella aestuarii]|uniref:GNAT family N-acetyltransferase n=1 Tax=Nioella aestuarii TaxID=1662864 RepID=UPI003D7F1DC7